MSILSDKQIRALCEKPAYSFIFYRDPNKKSNWFKPLQSVKHHWYDANDHVGLKAYIDKVKASEGWEDYVMVGVDPDFKPMVEPYESGQVRQLENGSRIVSYGTSSFGYDVRCADEFKIFTNVNSTIIDPKNFDDKSFVEFKGDCCIIPPNSFALARTVERFRIPRDVVTICLGKSTYARCGIIVNVTPFEPEWEGYVTLEFSNTTPLPAKIYANEGCAQVLFLQGNQNPEVSYADRNGKYMSQTGVVPPRM